MEVIDNTSGRRRALHVDADGKLLVAGALSGGSSDATAANQATQITAAGATNTKLDTLLLYTDGLEASNTACANSLSAVDTKLGTANTNSTTMASWDETARAKVNLIAAQAGVDGGSGASSAKTVRVILASDSPGGSSTSSATYTKDVSYTRPADTTTYAAGDVVAESTSAATILTFANAASANGKGGLIQGAVLIGSVVATLKPDFELYLFDTAPTMQNDNVAWAPSDAEAEKCIGMISLPGGYWRTMGANGMIEMDALSKSFNCAAGTTSIYGVLVVRNAYIPASGEKFTIRLKIIQD